MTVFGWRTSSRSLLAGEGACVQAMQVTRIDLRDADLSGVKTYLAGTHELSKELAQLVAEHDGVSPMLDRDDPFLEVVRALPAPSWYTPLGTAALLGNDPRWLRDGRGLRIPLPPTSGGQPRSITVSLNALVELTGSGFVRERVDARYELRYTVGNRSQVRHDLRKVTIPGGLELVTLSASAAAKRPAHWSGEPARVPRWGVPAGPGVPPPTARADRRTPSWTTPAQDQPPAIEQRLLNELTVLAKQALKNYLSASSAGTGMSDSPRPERPLDLQQVKELQSSLNSERVQELYGKLVARERELPVPVRADYIAQAHMNNGRPVRLAGGKPLEDTASGGSPGVVSSVTPQFLSSQVSEAIRQTNQLPEDASWARRSPQQQRWERLAALARLLYGDREDLFKRPNNWLKIRDWDWELLCAYVEGLGEGGTALVTVGPPGDIDHAFAVVYTTDGLQIADLDNAEGVVEVETVLPASIRQAFEDTGRGMVRALFVSPAGRPVIDNAWPISGWSREQLNFRYGPAVYPKNIAKDERGDCSLQLNKLWYRLEDFPRRLLVENPEVTWLYAVDEDGQIRIGTVYADVVLSGADWEKLDSGLTSVGRSHEWADYRLGHPTVAADFTKDGKALPGRARVSGELRWNARENGGRGRWEVNDDSGRYMRYRSDLDQNVTRWLSTVADDLAEHFSLDFTPRRFGGDLAPRSSTEWWRDELDYAADSVNFSPEQLFAVANYAKFDISSEISDLTRFLMHEHDEPVGRLKYEDIVEANFKIDNFVEDWRNYERSRARGVAIQLLRDVLEPVWRESPKESRSIPEEVIDGLVDRLLLRMPAVLELLHRDDHIKAIYGTPKLIGRVRPVVADIFVKEWWKWSAQKELSGSASSPPSTNPTARPPVAEATTVATRLVYNRLLIKHADPDYSKIPAEAVSEVAEELLNTPRFLVLSPVPNIHAAVFRESETLKGALDLADLLVEELLQRQASEAAMGLLRNRLASVGRPDISEREIPAEWVRKVAEALRNTLAFVAELPVENINDAISTQQSVERASPLVARLIKEGLTRDQPPSIEQKLLNDLTVWAQQKLNDYLAASSAATGASDASRPERPLDPQRVEELYHRLPEWMRKSPVPEIADRIAQAHLNKGELLLFPGGHGPEGTASGGSSRATGASVPRGSEAQYATLAKQINTSLRDSYSPYQLWFIASSAGFDLSKKGDYSWGVPGFTRFLGHKHEDLDRLTAEDFEDLNPEQIEVYRKAWQNFERLRADRVAVSLLQNVANGVESSHSISPKIPSGAIDEVINVLLKTPQFLGILHKEKYIAEAFRNRSIADAQNLAERIVTQVWNARRPTSNPSTGPAARASVVDGRSQATFVARELVEDRLRIKKANHQEMPAEVVGKVADALLDTPAFRRLLSSDDIQVAVVGHREALGKAIGVANSLVDGLSQTAEAATRLLRAELNRKQPYLRNREIPAEMVDELSKNLWTMKLADPMADVDTAISTRENVVLAARVLVDEWLKLLHDQAKQAATHVLKIGLESFGRSEMSEQIPAEVVSKVAEALWETPDLVAQLRVADIKDAVSTQQSLGRAFPLAVRLIEEWLTPVENRPAAQGRARGERSGLHRRRPNANPVRADERRGTPDETEPTDRAAASSSHQATPNRSTERAAGKPNVTAKKKTQAAAVAKLKVQNVLRGGAADSHERVEQAAIGAVVHELLENPELSAFRELKDTIADVNKVVSRNAELQEKVKKIAESAVLRSQAVEAATQVLSSISELELKDEIPAGVVDGVANALLQTKAFVSQLRVNPVANLDSVTRSFIEGGRRDLIPGKYDYDYPSSYKEVVKTLQGQSSSDIVARKLWPSMMAGLKSLEIEAISMPGDGDCFFHSLLDENTPKAIKGRIADVLNNDEPTIQLIRAYMANFLAAAFKAADSSIASFFTATDPSSRETYVNDIRLMGSYDNEASDNVAELFSYIFGVPLEVWQPQYRQRMGYDDETTVPLIVVRGGLHFWAAGTRYGKEPTLTSPAKPPVPSRWLSVPPPPPLPAGSPRSVPPPPVPSRWLSVPPPPPLPAGSPRSVPPPPVPSRWLSVPPPPPLPAGSPRSVPPPEADRPAARNDAPTEAPRGKPRDPGPRALPPTPPRGKTVPGPSGKQSTVPPRSVGPRSRVGEVTPGITANAADGRRSLPEPGHAYTTIDPTDGALWFTAQRSAIAPDGTEVPVEQQACVSVSVTVLTKGQHLQPTGRWPRKGRSIAT